MLSIRKVVSDILGGFVAKFMKDKFESYKMISGVECPTLIIHGQSDDLISYNHSSELYKLASNCSCELILPENMDHNEFDFYHEFSEPLIEFLSRNGVFAHLKEYNTDIDRVYFEVPTGFDKPTKQWNCLTKLLKMLSLN